MKQLSNELIYFILILFLGGLLNDMDRVNQFYAQDMLKKFHGHTTREISTTYMLMKSNLYLSVYKLWTE